MTEKIQGILEKCGAAGKNRAPNNCDYFDLNLLRGYINEETQLCELSFKLACLEENERIECLNGQDAAMKKADCDDRHSENFKVKSHFSGFISIIQ